MEEEAEKAESKEKDDDEEFISSSKVDYLINKNDGTGKTILTIYCINMEKMPCRKEICCAIRCWTGVGQLKIITTCFIYPPFPANNTIHEKIS